MYIVEFDRFGFMRLNKQCKQLLNDNILYGKNEKLNDIIKKCPLSKRELVTLFGA